jgi:hypothetical protein
VERGQISLRQAENLAKTQESELQGIRSKVSGSFLDSDPGPHFSFLYFDRILIFG